MQPSRFNLRVDLPETGEVFLMNTLTDAQLVVPTDLAALLDSLANDPDAFTPTAQSETARVLTSDEREALVAFTEHGFIVPSRDADDRALDRFFTEYREDTEQLRVTVLTTLQCNFACDYCFQGDHGDYNKFAEKMSMETAARVAAWVEERVVRLHPKRLTITFFGGEPLLNLPVMYDLAERADRFCRAHGTVLALGIITNGLLLTPPDAIRPSFGPGSAARHRTLARAAKASWRFERLPSLLLDIDTGEDLAALRERLAGTGSAAMHTRAVLGRRQRPRVLSASSSA